MEKIHYTKDMKNIPFYQVLTVLLGNPFVRSFSYDIPQESISFSFSLENFSDATARPLNIKPMLDYICVLPTNFFLFSSTYREAFNFYTVTLFNQDGSTEKLMSVLNQLQMGKIGGVNALGVYFYVESGELHMWTLNHPEIKFNVPCESFDVFQATYSKEEESSVIRIRTDNDRLITIWTSKSEYTFDGEFKGDVHHYHDYVQHTNLPFVEYSH